MQNLDKLKIVLQDYDFITVLGHDNIDVDALNYFKDQSSESGIPYQKLMNLYLVDCAKSKKKLEVTWK